MGGLRTIWVIALVTLAGLAPLPVRAGDRSPALTGPCASPSRHALVYALGGVVYRVNDTGTETCRVTAALGAMEPVLAPDGRLVAFLSGTGSLGNSKGETNAVRVKRVGGAPTPGTAVRKDRVLQGFLAWSPDGRRLAFIDGNDLWEWGTHCRCARRLVRGTTGRPVRSFAWSPDSRRVAAALIPRSPPPRGSMHLVVADAATGRAHSVVAQFPRWVAGAHLYAGSYPSGISGWLSGGTLLLATSGWGIGVWLTSLWTAPPSGGMAHETMGPPKGMPLSRASPLRNATIALPSPNHKQLLLAQENTFWLGSLSGEHGRHLVHTPCIVTQVRWAGSGRLEYVTVCNTAARTLWANLYVVMISGGRTTRLLRTAVTVPTQARLSIALPMECIRCGAG